MLIWNKTEFCKIMNFHENVLLYLMGEAGHQDFFDSPIVWFLSATAGC
jgi:hypothetical protein